MKKLLISVLVVSMLIPLFCTPVKAVPEYIISAVTDCKKYNINQPVIMTIVTSKEVTRLKILNEDGTIYNFAGLSAGFKDYLDVNDTRVWTLKKRAQFYFFFTKEVIPGTDAGYFDQSFFVSYEVQNYSGEIPEQMSGFLRAKGNILVDGENTENPVILKGISLGNDVYGNPSLPPKNHHTEKSYQELSELGFNSVRFYLNYGIFEDDASPYIYKQTGWDWLDKNIEWAKKYNIRLILNMHYPQGKYQSDGGGMELWTVQENQKRLIALWTAIANRYKDEKAIGGYDLLNEPIVPILGTPEETIGQWKTLAQQITDSIRTVDKNHLIIVERVLSVKDIETGETPWETSSNYNDNMNYFLIHDDNVAYEFHTYDPFYFTHQYVDWSSFSGKTAVYPDEDRAILMGEISWMTTSFNNPSADFSDSGWQYLQGERFKVEDENYKASQITVQILNTGETGTVWIDDLVIREFDKSGNYVRDVAALDFSSSSDLDDWSIWSSDGKGTYGYDDIAGHNKAGCIKGSGTTADANIGYNLMFVPKQGYSYEISGYVKVQNISSNSAIKLRTDFWNCDKVMAPNREYLEYSLQKFLSFGTENNVPLYLGEFGVDCYGFQENRGGDIWVSDMLYLCNKYNLNFNYHTYHEPWFGLYANDANSLPDNLNTNLYDIFKKELANID